VHGIAAELEAGLVFLDRGDRVIARSDAVPEIVNGFTSRPVEAGQSWPDELSFTNGAERVIRRHGITLKVVRSRQRRYTPTVIVLTRSVAALDLPPLSSREDEVMQWLSEGKSNEEIGIILSISPHTVKNHLDRIYRKIGVANRHAATLAWSRSRSLPGMIPCP
jgi:DNA-binding CsgD family transcriptional regulator